MSRPPQPAARTTTTRVASPTASRLCPSQVTTGTAGSSQATTPPFSEALAGSRLAQMVFGELGLDLVGDFSSGDTFDGIESGSGDQGSGTEETGSGETGLERALQAGSCLAHCPKNTRPWPNKCSWKGCSGCTPYCQPPAAGDEEPTSVGCSIPVSAGEPLGQPSYCADEPDLFNGFEPAQGCLTLCDETPSCAYVSLWASGWCRLTPTCSELRRTGNSMAVTVTCATPRARQLSPPSVPLPPPP